jgi:hypothetical protein
MPDLIALRAMFGQDEANHGTVRYRVGIDRLVTVPPEVAIYLINNGGFAVAKRTAAWPAKPQPIDLQSGSLVRLHHTTAGSCSYDGDKNCANGGALAPAEAFADLKAHSFMPIQLESPQEHSSETAKPTHPANAPQIHVRLWVE